MTTTMISKSKKALEMIIKIPNSLLGLLLMVFNLRIFSVHSIFKDKTIAIIGPADSAYQEENGKYIDNFDYVIRLNKAIVNWDNTKEKYIGTKTDILIHSFQENVDTGGGKLDFDLFDEKGVQFVINAKYNYLGLRTIFNFYKKYLSSRKVYVLSKKTYVNCNKYFKNKKPTNGFRALSMVFGGKPKKIFITGFTFFKTPYIDGYRDSLGKDLVVLRNNEKKRGLHDPDYEFQIFLKFLKQSNSEIIMDKKLETIVKEQK